MNALTQELSVHEIRQRTGHPLIDGDGHLIEVREAFVRFYGGTEPGFFAGTAVESAAREVALGTGH